MAKNSSILTPVGVASFLNLKEPRAVVQGSDPRYSINLIFDKAAQATPEFKELSKAIERVSNEKWPNKKPPGLLSPWHDGAEKSDDYAGYKPGDIFIIPWSKQKPVCINRSKQEILDWSEFWAGWEARAFVTPFAFDNVKRGVGLGLDSVQFMKKGARLDGRKGRDDFPDVPEDEDEEEKV